MSTIAEAAEKAALAVVHDAGVQLGEKDLRIEQLERELSKLQEFKAYVHERLDDIGVPSDPNPAGTAHHGCRIGERLDWVEIVIAEENLAQMACGLAMSIGMGPPQSTCIYCNESRTPHSDHEAEFASWREHVLVCPKHPIREVEQELAAAKRDYLGACRTMVDVYEAATGRVGLGPVKGVVEDARAVRDALQRLLDANQGELDTDEGQREGLAAEDQARAALGSPSTPGEERCSIHGCVIIRASRPGESSFCWPCSQKYPDDYCLCPPGQFAPLCMHPKHLKSAPQMEPKRWTREELTKFHLCFHDIPLSDCRECRKDGDP